MKLSKQLVVVSLVISLLAAPAAAKTPAQEPMLARVGKAAAGVLEMVGNWNKAIDQLTNAEVRRQLHRRMFVLYRQMQDLERKKQNLLESVLAERFIADNVEADIDRLRGEIQIIRQTLDGVSAALGTQQSFDGRKFESLMNDDLNEKTALLIQARREEDRNKLIQELQSALVKIKDARQAVAECLKKLE